MSYNDNQSREISRLLERTAASTFNMDTEKMIAKFDEAEKSCISLVSSEQLQLEIKRRVAEWKLKILCDRNSSFESVDILHDEILNFGFSSLENEGTIELYFAKYCVRQNKFDVAERIISRLCPKIDQALKENDSEVYRHFKIVAEQVLAANVWGL